MKKLFAFLISLALIVGCVSVGQVAFAAQTYTITKDTVVGGTITLSVTSASEGDTVTFQVAAATNYTLKSVTVKTTSPRPSIISTTALLRPRNTYQFTMPASNVIVTATFVAMAKAHWDNAAGDVAAKGAATVHAGDPVTPILSIDSNPGFIGLTVTLDYDASVFEIADDWNLLLSDAFFFTPIHLGQQPDPDPNIKSIMRSDTTTDYTGTGEIVSLNAAIKDDVSPGTYSLTCTLVGKHADNTTYNYTITKNYVVEERVLSMHIDNAAGDMAANGVITAHRGETLELAVYVDENPGVNRLKSQVTWYSSNVLHPRDPDDASSGVIFTDLGWEVFPSVEYNEGYYYHGTPTYTKTSITNGWEYALFGAWREEPVETGNGLVIYKQYLVDTERTGVLYTFTVKIRDDAPFDTPNTISLGNVSVGWAAYEKANNAAYADSFPLGTLAGATIVVEPVAPIVDPPVITARLDNYDNDMLNNGTIYAYPGQTLTLYTVVDTNEGFVTGNVSVSPEDKLNEYGFEHLSYGTVGSLYAYKDHVKGAQGVLQPLTQVGNTSIYNVENYTHEFYAAANGIPWHSRHIFSGSDELQTGTGRMFYDKIRLDPDITQPGTYHIALNFSFTYEDPNNLTGYSSWSASTRYANIVVLPEEIPESERNVVVGSSLTMNGTIGLNLYLRPQEDVADGGYVNIKGPNSFDQTYYFNNLTPTANGYRFSVPIYSPQLWDGVEVRLYNADDELQPIFFNNGRQIDNVFVTSVYDYCKRAEAATGLNAELLTLVENLQLYTTTAFLHFNGVSTAVAGSYSFTDAAGYDPSAFAGIDVSTLSGFAPVTVGTLPQGVIYRGMSLLLKEVTSLRLYFDVESGATMPTVMIDGVAATVYTNAAGQKYIEIPDIASPYLDMTHSIIIGGGTYVMIVSALSYAQHVLELYPEPDGSHNSTTPFISDLVKTLYLYNAAANDYFNA